MTTPHDERFTTPPAIGEADPKDYPKGLKLAMMGSWKPCWLTPKSSL